MKSRIRTDRNCRLWCVLLAALVAGAPACSDAARDSAVDVLEQTGSAFAAIAAKAKPAVVFIKAEKTVAVGGGVQPFSYNDPFGFFGDDMLRRFFHGHGFDVPHRQPRQFRQMGQGSGFIISEDGYILTNHHVVGDADKITVKLNDGREFEADRIGTDAKSEVAVIKIKGEDLPYLELGDSSAIRVGEWAVAIGNPFGLAATVTAGVISAKGRTGLHIADYENFIQTDAAINPGNSGGPLLNIQGEVVGINTAIYSRSGGNMGIGFAIPINMAKSIKEQLVKSGKVTRGYLGIMIQEMTADLAKSFGLDGKRGILVADVTDDSPAEKAGLKQGDIVLELNGKPIENVGTFRNEVASNPPGTRLRLTVFRDGREKDIKIKTGQLPDDIEVAAGSSELSEKLGLSVQDLSEEHTRKFGYEQGDGVLVAEVEQGGLAWQAGIQPGNLIVSVNQTRVASAREFLKAAAKAERDGSMLLLVRGKDYSRYIVLRLD